MKTNKLLSILLALVMMLSVVPFYASAEAVSLTEANVVEWPTVEYKNTDGMYYYEQPVEEGLALKGGVVTTDGTVNGTVVKGEFVFNYEDEDFPSSGTRKANIKFVPEDLITYTGFDVDSSTNVTFVVTKATPVFEDAKNNPLIASEVKAGSTLATSTLSGGKVVNPYNANAPKLATKSWSWSDKKTVVTESGYYEAKLTCPSYNTIYAQVYVRIIGDTSVTVEIEEMPTVEAITYKDGLTAGDLVITGGKASVAGSFKVKDATQALAGGKNTVPVVFVPEDTTLDEIEVSLTVTVEKIPTYFIDENGNETVPEIRMPVYSTLSDGALVSYIERLTANCGEFSASQVQASNVDTTTLGEYECTARITPKSEYYSTEDLTFKLIVEPKEIEVTQVIYGASGKFIGVYTETERDPKGTYDVYVDGVLAGTGLEYGTYRVECPWEPEASGTYSVKVVYNPIENDKYTMEDYTTDLEVNVARALTTEGLSSTLRVNGKPLYSSSIVNGDEITLECNLDVFAGWEITDAQGNAIDLGVDLTAKNIIFTMPDYDIIVKAKSTLDEEEKPGDDDNTDEPTDEPSGGLDDIFGDLTEGDSDSPIINFFNNIIAWFRNLIETIKNFFRGIGNVS